MSEIQRFRFKKTITAGGLTWEFMNEATDGEWVKYIDHRAEVERVTAERDAAQAEVERLTKERNNAKADLEWLRATQSVQNLNTANRQAILDSSRPTDEDIWREAFMALCGQSLKEGYMIRGESADAALAVYRQRWPR